MTPKTGKRYFVGFVFDPTHAMGRGMTPQDAALAIFNTGHGDTWKGAMLYYVGTARDNGDGTLTCDALVPYPGTGKAYATFLAEYQPDPDRVMVISRQRGPIVIREA